MKTKTGSWLSYVASTSLMLAFIETVVVGGICFLWWIPVDAFVLRLGAFLAVVGGIFIGSCIYAEE